MKIALRKSTHRIVILASLLFGGTALAFSQGALSAATSFTDVRQDPVFYPHIQRMMDQNFVQGETLGGVPTGKFLPEDPIKRSEFAKVTAWTRLAEKFGIAEKWDGISSTDMAFKMKEKFLKFYKCDHSSEPSCSTTKAADIVGICNVCESIGGKPFSDVLEKAEDCDLKGTCVPWFNHFVYYAVRKGYIQGYPGSGGTRLFIPNNSVLRIHALKMLVADNGNIPPEEDIRYKRLMTKAVTNGSLSPKCLKGSENFIRDLNGGHTESAEKLLKYALLADRLDLFGSKCEGFGSATTRISRAKFLQYPLTRKEAPRWFALTMEYAPMEPDAAKDPTVNTPEENSLTAAADKSYKEPDYEKTELYTPATENPNDESTEYEIIQSEDTWTSPKPEPLVQKTQSAPVPGSLPTSQDKDQDGISDAKDNCPSASNPSQLDSDRNGTGDLCQTPVCGNRVTELGETCDDGNQKSGDGCSTSCLSENPTGLKTATEAATHPKTATQMTNLKPISQPTQTTTAKSLASAYPETKSTAVLTACVGTTCTTIPKNSAIRFTGDVSITKRNGVVSYTEGVWIGDKRYDVPCDQLASDACKRMGWNPKAEPGKEGITDSKVAPVAIARTGDVPTTSEATPDTAVEDSKKGNSDANSPNPVSQSWAEPINILTGNFWSEKTDLYIPIRGGVAEIKRTYNAQSLTQGSFGMGWSFDYDTRLEKNALGDLVLTFGDGHSLYFESEGHGRFRPYTKTTGTFSTKRDALIYREKDGTEYVFNKEGKLASIKDRNGNGPEFGLGADGTIQTVRDSIGTLFTLRRDEQGRITSAKDFGGRKTTYSYTKAGDLSKVCGPNRSACYRYAYDDKHRLLTIQNELGHTMIANKYDDRDRVTEQTDTMGGVSKLRYEKGKTWLTDPMGNTKTQEYDANYQTTAETDALGNTVRFEYDERGNFAKSTDVFGHVTIYKYDDSGNRISETNASGTVTTFKYNRAHQATQIKSPNGGTTILKYGPDGNLAETIDPMENRTVFTYDRFGRKTRQTDPNLATTLWIWNEDGTLLWTLDAVGRRTDYAYDNLRRPIRVTDSLGNATRIAYDSKGQVSETVNALGGKRKIGTDKAGNKTFETNENGATKRYSYDDKNRMVLETSASGNSITYEYDLNDHLARTTDSKGNKTSYEYDPAGRLVSVTNPLGETTKTEYDAAGKKTAIIDGNGNRTTFEYDALGQLSKATDAAGNATTFEHDTMGNLVKTTDALGNATVAEYDLAGRLISSTGPLGDKTKTDYDNMNRKTKFEIGNSKLEQFGKSQISNFEFQVSSTEYDILGNPIRSINTVGAVTEYKYDALGRVTEEIDPNGNRSFTEYDALGNVASLTDALGNITRFAYDKAGNRTGVTDALGNTTRYEYDRFGRLLTVTNALGGTTMNEYDPMGNIVRITDARGAKLEYEYDAVGRLIRGTNSDGLVTAFEYDANGNRIRSTMRAGADERTTTTEYDALNRPVAVTNALGQTVRAEYDALGRKAKEISADGQVVQNEFDTAGRLVRTLDPMGNAQTNTYDLLGQLITATDLNGNVRRFAYSPAGRLVSMTDAMGNTLRYEYDKAGNRVATIDPLGTKSVQKFDALGRLVSALDANGNGDIYEYDAVGNKVSQAKVSASGKIFNKTVYAYDALRRLVSATDALGGTVRYEYDANSNRTAVINQNGNVTKTEFDLMNRPVRTVDALGNSETWEYDKFGEMVAHTDKNGVTEKLTYDGLGRLIKKEKGGIIVAQEYDEAGRMTKLSDSNSLNCDYGDYADGPDCNVSNQNPQIISAEYDLRGFLTKVTDTKGRVTTYSYDKAGNVMSRKDPSGSVAYQYDSRNLAQRISWLPMGSKKAADYRFSFDPRGLLAQIAANDKSSVNYGFDLLGRLEKIEANDDKKAVWSAEYGYDDFGLKTSAMVTAIGSDPTIEEYAYDDAGRLVNWTKDGKAESYGYDLAYNRTGVTSGGKTVTYAYNGLNQLMSDGARTFAYDANGNLVSDGRQGYTWDALGRLTSVKTGDGSVDYSYDPLNRMAERVSGPDSLASDGAGGDRTTFAYPGLADKFVSQSDPGTETKYLYDMNGSPLANQTNGRPGLLVRNAHNDVVGGVNGGMSAYSPFGSTTTGISNTLGFQGQFSDANTNLSQLGARFYDSETAQFLSPDPFPGLVSEPQGMNRYAYSHNDPVNFWDVTGAYDMEVHYFKTKDWAYEAATNMGFSYEMSRQLALNIASFDQYHDKEWSLVPNNYSMGDGQGNSTHLLNPDRQQIDRPGITTEAGKGPFTQDVVNAGNEYSDPLVRAVGATTIPVYAMKSLSEFNTSEGADRLISDPRAIRDGKALGFLTMRAGTPRERLQYAIDQHDPRLFGIAMHEYQDSFAHAGFNLWHGTSHDNDYYCESETDKDYCKGEVVVTQKGGGTVYDYKYVNIGTQLLERDRLMKEGTQYWMKKFMEGQADYYKSSIFVANKASQSFNKEEKVLHDANRVLKVEEEFDSPQFADNLGGTFGVFTMQGAGIGDSPCSPIILNNYNPLDNDPGLGACKKDYDKMIIRQ